MQHTKTKVRTGTLPDPAITHIAHSHPFTQQLDVLFPSNDALTTALSSLHTHYTRIRACLFDTVQHAHPFISPHEAKSTLTVLGLGVPQDSAPETWCIDPRGLLTLCVTKETYERLGLVGTPLSAAHHGHAAQYVVRVPLQRGVGVVSNEKRNVALKAWDAQRERVGLTKWDIVYHSEESVEALGPGLQGERRAVRCMVSEFGDMRIPAIVQIPPRPPVRDAEGVEDWNVEMGALFEWVGMACLGAQRLKANDRVDPYVALYEPPMPASVGALTRLRWTGLLPTTFVQTVVDTALAATGTGATGHSTFLAIMSHGVTAAPVGYIPPGDAEVEGMLRTPVRVPNPVGQDTWCMLVVPGDSENTQSYALAESIDRYDARWG